jgi:hypothetical protein
MEQAQIFREVLQHSGLGMWTVRVSKLSSFENDGRESIAPSKGRADQETPQQLTACEGPSIPGDSSAASIHEIIDSLAKLQNEFECVKRLLLCNARASNHSLLVELKSIIADVADRFSRFLEEWREEVSPAVTIEKSHAILSAAREAKRRKQEHRTIVTQTHIHVLLLNKLNCATIIPQLEGDGSICNIAQTYDAQLTPFHT